MLVFIWLDTVLQTRSIALARTDSKDGISSSWLHLFSRERHNRTPNAGTAKLSAASNLNISLRTCGTHTMYVDRVQPQTGGSKRARRFHGTQQLSRKTGPLKNFINSPTSTGCS